MGAQKPFLGGLIHGIGRSALIDINWEPRCDDTGQVCNKHRSLGKESTGTVKRGTHMDVEKAVKTGNTAQLGTSVANPQGTGKLKILITEDDFASRRALQTFLSPYGDCVIAVNGFETVETFQDALDAGEPYDLICLDILMPEMNGHEALKAIRQAEREHEVDVSDLVKVIMATSKDSVQDIAEAFASGCDAYVVKPVNREKLCEEMRKLLLIK